MVAACWNGDGSDRDCIAGMATGFVVDVGALAVAVEDHDEFGGLVDGCEGVRKSTCSWWNGPYSTCHE